METKDLPSHLFSAREEQVAAAKENQTVPVAQYITQISEQQAAGNTEAVDQAIDQYQR